MVEPATLGDLQKISDDLGLGISEQDMAEYLSKVFALKFIARSFIKRIFLCKQNGYYFFWILQFNLHVYTFCIDYSVSQQASEMV